MLNNNQIKLLQVAVRKAGLRGKGFDGRYRLLLSQYKQPDGRAVTSCKQLNNWQLDDLLAICESHGWQMQCKAPDYYQKKVASRSQFASYAQQQAIKYLAGDLGWDDPQLCGFIGRQTNHKVTNIITLSPEQAYGIIEGLKAILGRKTGKRYSSLTQVQTDMEARDGKKQAG